MKNIDIAKKLIDIFGGVENIKDVSNCFTRIRFEIVETKKIDVLELNSMTEILTSYFDESSVEVVLKGFYTEEVANACVNEFGCKSENGILVYEKNIEQKIDESITSESLESSLSNFFNFYYKTV